MSAEAKAERAARRILAYLLAQRAEVYADIQSYPQPITGCDAQFNHLLEERHAISRDLNHLSRLLDAATTDSKPQGAALAVEVGVNDLQSFMEPVLRGSDEQDDAALALAYRRTVVGEGEENHE